MTVKIVKIIKEQGNFIVLNFIFKRFEFKKKVHFK